MIIMGTYETLRQQHVSCCHSAHARKHIITTMPVYNRTSTRSFAWRGLISCWFYSCVKTFEAKKYYKMFIIIYFIRCKCACVVFQVKDWKARYVECCDMLTEAQHQLLCQQQVRHSLHQQRYSTQDHFILEISLAKELEDSIRQDLQLSHIVTVPPQKW